MTYYGRWTYKFEETRCAAHYHADHSSHGLASYGWDVVRNSWGTERSYLKRDETPKLLALRGFNWTWQRELWAWWGWTWTGVPARADEGLQAAAIAGHLKAHVASQLRPFVSRNVLAMLQGTDAVLGKEAVLYTAHYDHLGIDPTLPGDKSTTAQTTMRQLRNSAGTGARVAAMRWRRRDRFCSLRSPRKSRDCLGRIFGKHAPCHGKDHAGFEFDDVPPLGTPEEVEVSGAERTTFYPVVQATARDFRLANPSRSAPGGGPLLTAQIISPGARGVPSFSINEGSSTRPPSRMGHRASQRFTEHRYHQPSDEYSPDMDFTATRVIARFGFVLGSKAAWLPTLAGWVPGDEFEPARKKSQASSPNWQPSIR